MRKLGLGLILAVTAACGAGPVSPLGPTRQRLADATADTVNLLFTPKVTYADDDLALTFDVRRTATEIVMVPTLTVLGR